MEKTTGKDFLTEKEQYRGMRKIVFTQCAGIFGLQVFQNGLILLYLLALHLKEARIITYISTLGLVNFIVIMPGAFYADRIGKKKIGNLGNFLMITGFLIISLSGFSPEKFICEILALSGIIVFAVGNSLFTSSWYPLLNPVIPENIRGRFFGVLRVSWQITGLIFAGAAALFVGKKGTVSDYQLIMGTVTFFLIVRTVFYNQIPEVTASENKTQKRPAKSFWRTVMIIISSEGFLSLAAYIFLLFLFTGCCISVFALVEKEVMGLNSDVVVWLANMTMIGSITGYFIGGFAVDRFGTKPVFIFCHFSYAVLLVLFFFRGFCPFMTMPILWFVHFGYGYVYASCSIAYTAEVFSLMPSEDQSMAAGFFQSATKIGIAGSGFLCATAINLGFLKDNWTFMGMNLSPYDAILLTCSVMILMLVITLGLIPSVLKKKPD